MANPLTDQDKAEIEARLAQLADAKADVARAKLAGIDVADIERQLNETESQLQRIKSAYFPTGRRT